jgi:hypothetical protein
MKRLIRILQEKLKEEDAILVPSIVANVVIDTIETPAAADRLREFLPKLGANAYDAVIKTITDGL